MPTTMPTTSDLERIVESALDAVGDEAGWRECLAQLRRIFLAEAAALIAHDFATGRGRWCLADRLDPSTAQTYAARWSVENPWLAEPTAYAAGRAVLGETLVATHELVRTAFYTDYLKPLGCWHRLAGTILRDGPRVLYVTLHRPAGARPFESADLPALEWLLPRLARPVALHRELLRRCTGTEAFRMLLDQVPHALFLVDGALRPLVMNAAATTMVEAAARLRLARGRLAAAPERGDEALQRAARAALAGRRARGGAVDVPLPHDGDLQPVLLRVAPLDVAYGFDEGSEDLLLILAIDPEARQPQPAALAARLWGLTPAETRLCGLLTRGLRPAEAARELALSPHTVHAQLRQIFAKAGVHRQADLLQLLERLSVAPL